MQQQPAPPETASGLSFKEGDKIEVRVQSDAAIWLPATFLRSSQNQIHAQFETPREEGDDRASPPPLRSECVSTGDVRPLPPPELHRYLKVGEMVEGFCKENKGWRKGHVVEILENSRYTVSFEVDGRDDSVAEMEQWEVRAFREWANGFWVPPFLLQEVLQKKSLEVSKPRGLIIKLKCPGKAFNKPKFTNGMLVEVKSDEEGFRGSFFTAVILKSMRDDKYLVEYRTLRTEAKMDLLKEEVDVSCIRFCPPVIQRILPFEHLDRVDAWYNDGWWEGHVVQVLNSCKYTVYFTNADEEMTFEHFKLRPHQECVDGKWCGVPKVNLSELKVNLNEVNLKQKRTKNAPEQNFSYGMMVEVKSDEEGYQGSWYTAIIVCSLCSDNYLVEYQTLKSEDESALLREKAFASYIRPCPPKIVRVECFNVLDEVDAWYNDGWWVGLVSNVLDGLKYRVYFWTTNEELVFDHFSLRPHQEWVGGKWIVSSKKKLKFVVKNKLGQCNQENEKMGLTEPIYTNGTTVEIKGDEPGYMGSWYPAAIVKALGNRKYLVEYLTLTTDDDGSQLQKEVADVLCMRPCPPVVQRKHPYKLSEEIDAWHNGGWRVGRIYQALEGRKYTVYFNISDEILEFQHSELRPHRDWIDGQWVFAKSKRGRPRKLALELFRKIES